jgi:hypothetical protein
MICAMTYLLSFEPPRDHVFKDRFLRDQKSYQCLSTRRIQRKSFLRLSVLYKEERKTPCNEFPDNHSTGFLQSYFLSLLVLRRLTVCVILIKSPPKLLIAVLQRWWPFYSLSILWPIFLSFYDTTTLTLFVATSICEQKLSDCCILSDWKCSGILARNKGNNCTFIFLFSTSLYFSTYFAHHILFSWIKETILSFLVSWVHYPSVSSTFCGGNNCLWWTHIILFNIFFSVDST